MNRTRNAHEAARTYESFVYSTVKMTRLYDYKTWPTHLFKKLTRCAKACGLFFLDFAFRVLIGWEAKLQSRGTTLRRLLRHNAKNAKRKPKKAICGGKGEGGDLNFESLGNNYNGLSFAVDSKIARVKSLNYIYFYLISASPQKMCK